MWVVKRGVCAIAEDAATGTSHTLSLLSERLLDYARLSYSKKEAASQEKKKLPPADYTSICQPCASNTAPKSPNGVVAAETIAELNITSATAATWPQGSRGAT